MARYLISDFPSEDHGFKNNLWHHLFADGGRETPVRFVYDTENEEVVVAFIQGGTTTKAPFDTAEDWWVELSSDLTADVQDSVHDNLGLADMIPGMWESFGLIEADILPDWAEKSALAPSPSP